MKNLFYLFSICIFICLLILSCQNKSTPTDNKASIETAIKSASTPKKQFSKATIALEDKGDENNPQFLLTFSSELQNQKIIEHHSCTPIFVSTKLKNNILRKQQYL